MRFAFSASIAQTVVVGALIFCGVSSEGAEGLRTLPESAEALGKVGGRYATQGDPAVVRSNPASLLDLEGTQFQFNFQLWHGETDFSSPAGLTDSMILPWKELGSVFLTHRFNEDLAVGLGISTPFGVTINWPRQGAFRYALPYDTVLQNGAINPAIAWRVNKAVTIGAGLDIHISRMKLDQAYPWALTVPGAPDGDATYEADGAGVGAYVGLNFDLGCGRRLSLMGRLPVQIDYEGEFTVNQIPTPLAGLVQPTTPFLSSMEFPGSVAVGYGQKLSECTEIGFDLEWIGNSTHEQVPLDIGTNQFMLGGKDVLPLQWQDSWSLGFGVSHHLSPCLVGRAGYLFSASPMSEATYLPAVPSNDRHIFSVGLGVTTKRGVIDLGYNYIHMEDLVVNGNVEPAFDGAYDYSWHILSVSHTRKF